VEGTIEREQPGNFGLLPVGMTDVGTDRECDASDAGQEGGGWQGTAVGGPQMEVQEDG
jgi:hypothetical protein